MRLSRSSPNVFVFVQKDWLTFFDGTNRPGEPYYNFSISNDLTQMINFQVPGCDPLIFLIFFFSS